MERSSPFNGVSAAQSELPKLSLKDTVEENSFSTVSSPAPGPLSPLMGKDMDDLQDVPINDNEDNKSSTILQSQSQEMVNQLLISLISIGDEIKFKLIH